MIEPVATFNRSSLRKREVVERAAEGPVEILRGAGEEPLLLLSQRLVKAHAEVQELAEVFVRAVVELQRADPSAAVLGEVGYVADWAPEDRQLFLVDFAEAVAESLRTGDPAPARGFVAVMERADRPVSRRDLRGEISEEAHDAVIRRLGERSAGGGA